MRRSRVDFGRPILVTRGLGGRLSARVDTRMVVVCGLIALLALVVGILALGVGDLPISPGRVIQALLGDGTRLETTVVVKWRLPRIVLALVLGALLGASGAIFQSVTRNPLGSPDVIGFNTGAYTGALIVILLVGQKGYYETAGGALLGGVVTAFGVYLLAYRRGVQGFRLIIVGIAVSAILTSINAWILVKADLDRAMSASVWGAGSLNGLRWVHATPVLIVAAVCVPLLVVAAARMPILDLGDDAAKAVGLRAEGTRLYLVLVGVVLTAVATAAAGPIAFVSLAAPQIARRLTGTPGVGLLPAAVVGALLLVAGDLVAQRVFAPTPLPVGVVTVSIGGVYLVWLLFKEGRKQ